MSADKLSINRACAVGAAFLGVISATAIGAAVLLTKNLAVVCLVLLFVALVFACVASFVSFLRHKLVLFSDNLCRTIDDMLDGAAPPPQICEEESLFYKINCGYPFSSAELRCQQPGPDGRADGGQSHGG